MTETIPAEVLSAMGNTLPYGDNETRCRDIAWALKAAEAMGFVMVPTEATEAMRDAADDLADPHDHGYVSPGRAYRAMIAARPKVP